MMVREAVLDVGCYDEKYVHAQDYDLFWRLACKYPIATLPEALYCYRVHNRRVTSDRKGLMIQRRCAKLIQSKIEAELDRK